MAHINEHKFRENRWDSNSNRNLDTNILSSICVLDYSKLQLLKKPTDKTKIHLPIPFNTPLRDKDRKPKVNDWYKKISNDTKSGFLLKKRLDRYYNTLCIPKKESLNLQEYMQKVNQEIKNLNSRVDSNDFVNESEKLREYRMDDYPKWINKCWNYDYVLDEIDNSKHNLEEFSTIENYFRLCEESDIKMYEDDEC